jgi:hypothetical protein
MDGINYNASAQELYGMLVMLIQMFQPTYDPSVKAQKTTKAVMNTTIELYDYIRHVRIHPPELKLPFPHSNGKAMGLADRPAESLEYIQDALDSYIISMWNGGEGLF